MRLNLLAAAAALLTLGACAAPAPDYAAEHKAVLDAFIAGWNEGNMDVVDTAVTANFRRIETGRNVDGPAALKAAMTELRASYPDMKVVLDENHHMKDVSFHLWTFTGTNTGPGAAPPTGKSVSLPGATLLRYQDGKISEEVVYFDVLNWQMQLGYTLAAPASEAVAN